MGEGAKLVSLKMLPSNGKIPVYLTADDIDSTAISCYINLVSNDSWDVIY